MFRILVTDDNHFDSHAGEEWDDVKEVLVNTNSKLLQEYEYLFTGMFRSLWKEVDKEIYIFLDVGNPVYLSFFNDLTVKLQEEQIVLTLEFS